MVYLDESAADFLNNTVSDGKPKRELLKFERIEQAERFCQKSLKANCLFLHESAGQQLPNLAKN